MIVYVRRACHRVDIESGSQMYSLILTLFKLRFIISLAQFIWPRNARTTEVNRVAGQKSGSGMRAP